MVPSALPVGPWQTVQKFWYRVSPAASMFRGMTGTLGPGARPREPAPARGFLSAFAVVAFPAIHSADQSGSPPVTGTLPSGVLRGTVWVSYGWIYRASIM